MVTTYNEVADELVKEFKNDFPAGDEKNIRRRAYDALNVLTAMDIISKDKKDIQWKGFPNLSGDGGHQQRPSSTVGGEIEKEKLRAEIAEKQMQVSQKETQLEDLTLQYLSLLQLLQRNEIDSARTANKHRIYLPFVLGKQHAFHIFIIASTLFLCSVSKTSSTSSTSFASHEPRLRSR